VVADRLAERGHRLVAVRVVGHFSFDPSSFWYGKPSMQPEYAGWWNVFSVVQDPPLSGDGEWAQRWEARAVAALVREHGGVTSGPGGGHPDAVLRTFTRVGLVHDLDPAGADQRRRAVLDDAPRAPTPARQQARGLRYTARSGGRSEVLAVAEVARRIATDEAPVGLDASDCDDVTELLGDLFDEVLHQDSCYPWTAAGVPLIAVLAAEERLTDYHRAWVMLDLYMIATVGRRRLARTADALHALGKPATETPDVVAARTAVAAALPALIARWPTESELAQFMLAGLAAACPEAAASLHRNLDDLRSRYDGTSRATTMALVRGLAFADMTAVETALGELESIAPQLLDDQDSPYAATEHRALCVLEDLLTMELEHAQT
jgi:hypothetical protein